MSFRQMELREEWIKSLDREGVHTPTQIQREVFEPIWDGRNVAAQSETGSGKTLAYLLPLMKKMYGQEKKNKVLILVPTHELALQVTRQVKSLGQGMDDPILAQPIVGNVNIKRQIEALKEKPHIVVGTTGRIMELIEKKKIAAHFIETIVVDEADKMLDKNQQQETRAVIKKCMRDVQKLFFSASLSKDAVREMERIATDLQVIRTKEKLEIPQNINHVYIECEQRDKLKVLRSVISALEPQKAMVFINRVFDIELATEKLKHHSYAAECIHGSDKKADRKVVIDGFRNGKIKILVGTDMAARGLHFDGVDLVVHYSISENTKDYLHRAGRTGRNGKNGMSLSIVTKRELAILKKCEKEFGIKIQQCMLKKGMLIPVNMRN